MALSTDPAAEQLLSLQHAIRRLLPTTAAPEAPVVLAAAIYRACLQTAHVIRPWSSAKDEIWHLLRAAAVSPTPHDIDELHQLVIAIHARAAPAMVDALRPDDDRLSVWNDDAGLFYDQMLLTTHVGHRVNDPRPTVAASSSARTAPSSSSIASSSTSAATTAAASSSQPGHRQQHQGFDPSWLRKRCEQLAVVSDGGLPPHEMAASVLTLLVDTARTDDSLQSDLFDAFAGDFDAVGDVLRHRSNIRAQHDAIVADCSQAYEIHLRADAGPQSSSSAGASAGGDGVDATDAPRARGVRRRGARGERGDGRGGERNPGQLPGAQIIVHDAREKALRKEQERDRRMLLRAGFIPQGGNEEEEEDNALRATRELGGSAFEERQRQFQGVGMQRDSVIGSVDKVTLPKGSTREVGKGYEEIFVPPPPRRPFDDNDLVDVSSGLAEHPELLRAMKGVKTLNRLQSTVFPIAFKTDENLLVCAPTGAGKTNVALLTIFREIVAVKAREKRNFKIVYVAPMKALAAEVTEKFGQRLGPLGLSVREFTGDMSLSRAEAAETHVLVTTPEKWDVVTRKSGSEVGEAVTLFIVDEIHLLHDDRGAVLESIVARTLRFSETAQRQIRLVGLSATLPNYKDVGSFMRVNPEKGLFHFDGSHRPVPLSQTFIGVSEGANSNSNDARRRKEAKMHELAWKKVKDSLQRGHQAMIFVHSRKGTAKAAREMITRASQDEIGDIFLGGGNKSGSSKNSFRRGADDGDDEEDGDNVLPSWAAKEVSKSKVADIRELCAKGVGIHNAGLPRPDRKLVERLFADGSIRLLCCTATLAWGVNLPARTVVIMGTEVYNAEKGGFVQLGMLDVMQIFGRAGRPQFDTEGEGIILTEHEHLAKYLNLLTSSIPIESQLGASASRMADHLNAEIVSGTVSSIGDGVRWLNYTYLSVRMPQNPLVYGINRTEVEMDFGLHSHRTKLIENACKELDDARMARYDPRSGVLSPTDLGRVSSHFYVSHETVVLWNELLSGLTFNNVESDEDRELVYSAVIHAVSCATEFEQMRSRQEEMDELEVLTRTACPIPLKREFGPETREGKVAILLQAHISRANIRMSDLSYIVQSATRLLRALFEISLRRGLPSFSRASLELARASESRIWPHQHPLWQFTYLTRHERGLLVTPESIAAIEESGEETDLATLRSKTRDELSSLIRAPRIVQTVEKVLMAIPTLEIVHAKVAPLSSTVLSVHVSLSANFNWHEPLHGHLESWWLWVEDKRYNRIFHSQKILLNKRHVQSLNADFRNSAGEKERLTVEYSLTVPVFNPPSSQYWVRVESDRWHTGGGSVALLSVASMQLPKEERFKSNLSSVSPSRLDSFLPQEETAWFETSFSHLSAAQVAALQVTRYGDNNVLVSAPSGSGKIAIAEFALLRAFSVRERAAVVFMSPDRGTLEVIEKRWKSFVGFGQGRMIVLDNQYRGGLTPDAIGTFSIILTTPKVWNQFVQTADERQVLRSVSLIVFNDLHRLSERRNIGMELLLTRLRRYRREEPGMEENKETSWLPRVVGFSEVLPNAAQLGEWMDVSRSSGLICLGPEARQIPCEVQHISVAGERYGSRMQSMNRPLYSTIQRYSVKQPVLIFVASRKQTLLTAQDLLRLASVDGNMDMFVYSPGAGSDGRDEAKHLRALHDVGLLQMVPKGIGLYHESMSRNEREAVEALFRMGRLQVVIATFAMAGHLSVRANSVIVKGTEMFDVRKRRFEDIASADVMQMTGLAGRMGVDASCHATVFVHEPKQTLFKMLSHDRLPVESGLLGGHFEEVLLQEIVRGGVEGCVEDVMDWLWNSFMWRRLCTSPGYYGLKKKGRSDGRGGNAQKVADAERRKAFCRELVESSLTSLEERGCVEVVRGHGSKETVQRVWATAVGIVCCECAVGAESGRVLLERGGDCVSMEKVVEVVNACEEMYDIAVEYDEETHWGRLQERVVRKFVDAGAYRNADLAAKALGITGWSESLCKRGRLLCYSFMVDGAAKVEEVRMGRGAAFQKLQTVLVGGARVAAVSEQVEVVKQWVRTMQCVMSGCVASEDLWGLCGVDVTGGGVEKGRKEGWKTMQDVMKDEKGFAMFVAREFGEVERSAIMRWVAAYPRIRVGDIGAGENGIITVEVAVRRKGGGGAGGDARGRRRGEGRLMVVVWQVDSQRVVGERRVVVMDGNGAEVVVGVTVDVGAKAMENVEEIGVWVGSEEHVGAEVETIANVQREPIASIDVEEGAG